MMVRKILLLGEIGVGKVDGDEDGLKHRSLHVLER